MEKKNIIIIEINKDFLPVPQNLYNPLYFLFLSNIYKIFE